MALTAEQMDEIKRTHPCCRKYAPCMVCDLVEEVEGLPGLACDYCGQVKPIAICRCAECRDKLDYGEMM